MLFVLLMVLAQLSADPLYVRRDDDGATWRPDDTTIATLESRLTIPERMGGPMSNFDRYYTGIYRNGHRVVALELVNLLAHRKDHGVIHIVRPSEFPAIADGGCGVINASYDLETKTLSDAVCNFSLPPPPSPPK